MIGRTLGRPGLRFGWGFTSCASVCSGFLRGRPRFFGSGALSLPGKASSKAASSSPSHFSRRFQYSSSTCGRASPRRNRKAPRESLPQVDDEYWNRLLKCDGEAAGGFGARLARQRQSAGSEKTRPAAQKTGTDGGTGSKPPAEAQAGAPQSSADHLWASSPKRSPSKGTLFRLTIVGRIEVLLITVIDSS